MIIIHITEARLAYRQSMRKNFQLRLSVFVDNDESGSRWAAITLRQSTTSILKNVFVDITRSGGWQAANTDFT
jgi:hypothetical protein